MSGYLWLHTLCREGREMEGVVLRVKGWSRVNWWASVTTRESRLREMAEGREKDNAGKNGTECCEISGLMEDKRGKVILNGSLASLMKRCQMYLGAIVCITAHRHGCRVGPSVTRIPSLSSLLSLWLSVSLSLPWVLYHAQATWILSKDEAKLVCKLSLSEIKTQLKPHEWKPKRV